MPLPLFTVPTQPVAFGYEPFGVSVSVLRLDGLHPQVSGNKWFKLHPSLAAAKAAGKAGLLTFGGAWSNHLLATAAACREAGLHAIGLVRGERPAALSSTLADAEKLGMELYFLSRAGYRDGKIPESIRRSGKTAHYLVVPEGGYGNLGCDGAARIADVVPGWADYSHVLAAVGTGTTLAGLVSAAGTGQRIMGIPVLKNNLSLEPAINALLPEDRKGRFGLLHDFHEGGYARRSPRLIAFMNEWFLASGIPSDFVYTGKLFLAADTLVRNGYFPAGSRLLLLHSGGLQGNRSLPAGTLIF